MGPGWLKKGFIIGRVCLPWRCLQWAYAKAREPRILKMACQFPVLSYGDLIHSGKSYLIEGQLISKPKGPAYEALDSRNRLGNFINTITFITALRWTLGDPTCPFGTLWSRIRRYIITLCPTRKVYCGRFFVAWRDVPRGLRDKQTWSIVFWILRGIVPLAQLLTPTFSLTVQ